MDPYTLGLFDLPTLLQLSVETILYWYGLIHYASHIKVTFAVWRFSASVMFITVVSASYDKLILYLTLS